MKTLRYKAVSGVKWSTISQSGRLGTQLLTTVILARILSPSDFGLVGMAMVVIGFVGIFKDLGTSAAIIQWKELSETLLSSIFWVNAGFGASATLLLFLFAPLGGLFYQEPRVVIILQALSTSFFISGLGIMHQALLERSVSFDKLAKVEIISVVLGAIVGVGLAIKNAGVWSLVFQTLTTVTLTTLLLWRSNTWRPQRIFKMREIKAISRFSLNLTGFNIFNYFARNADYLLIGRFLGAQDLGYYTLAYRILFFPIQNISAVIGRVLYPILSTVQDDSKRFAFAYLQVVKSIAFVTFPLMMGILALANPLVDIFLGEKWHPVILLIMILAPVGLIQSIGTTVGSIYQVKGRTDWMFRWGVGSGTLAVIAFIVGLRWGIVGVAVSYAVLSFLLFFPSIYIPFKLADLELVRLLRVLRFPFLNSSIMFVIVKVFSYIFVRSQPEALGLFLSTVVGVSTYLLLSWQTNRGQMLELWSLIWREENVK